MSILTLNIFPSMTRLSSHLEVETVPQAPRNRWAPVVAVECRFSRAGQAIAEASPSYPPTNDVARPVRAARMSVLISTGSTHRDPEKPLRQLDPYLTRRGMSGGNEPRDLLGSQDLSIPRRA